MSAQLAEAVRLEALQPTPTAPPTRETLIHYAVDPRTRLALPRNDPRWLPANAFTDVDLWMELIARQQGARRTPSRQTACSFVLESYATAVLGAPLLCWWETGHLLDLDRRRWQVACDAAGTVVRATWAEPVWAGPLHVDEVTEAVLAHVEPLVQIVANLCRMPRRTALGGVGAAVAHALLAGWETAEPAQRVVLPTLVRRVMAHPGWESAPVRVRVLARRPHPQVRRAECCRRYRALGETWCDDCPHTH